MARQTDKGSGGASLSLTELPRRYLLYRPRSRIVNSLVAKGLVTRAADEHDARNVHLYPTELAAQNQALMRDAWSAALSDTRADNDAIEAVNVLLRQIEAELAARSTTSSHELNVPAISSTEKTSIPDQE